MNYNIYIDESGNTGNIELREDFQWNYGNQPYFALGSLSIEETYVDDIRNQILQILYKYNPKLGKEQELKSKANYIFKNNLMEEITKLLCDKKTKFYFDIANKKYKVIMNMVDYCVYPYFVNEKYIFSRDEKINVANYLYKTLPKEIIKKYIDLCQRKCEEREQAERLLGFVEELEQYITCKRDKEAIKSVIEVIKNYGKYKLDVKHLFPVEDFNNKGTKESFLPNVDAYNNIIASLGKLQIRKSDGINIYHDEQKQFSNVLEQWTSLLKKYNININQLKFCVSKDDILIQITDFYTGNIVKIYKKIIDSIPLNRTERELIKIIKPLLMNCNIVAPRNEQELFFEKCGIKMMQTPIPINIQDAL